MIMVEYFGSPVLRGNDLSLLGSLRERGEADKGTSSSPRDGPANGYEKELA